MERLGALVGPSAPLDAERLARYRRHEALPGFDELAQRRLWNARALVVGAGGLGSATVPYLASAGIGTIGVVDTDAVELSNLHRQIAHSLADVGRSKLDSIADAVAAIDPGVRVVKHSLRLDSGNALGVLDGYDLVLDGSDNFPTRYLVADAAELSGIPVVWGSILGYGGQAGISWAAKGPRWRDLFPDPPAPGDVPSCAVGGVLPGVCATIGSLMVTETMKLITGIGEPLLGRVTVYDALTGRFREVPYARADDAPDVTELIDYDVFCGLPPAGATTEVSPARLAEMLTGEVQLVDVREPWEAELARLPGAEVIPLGRLIESIDRIRDDVPVIVYCQSGARSAQALRMLDELGIPHAGHLAGGIDAYARQVDPTLARR